jgi:predicted O-linked N-acetylglucosamine transferase (SPINDLY family)
LSQLFHLDLLDLVADSDTDFVAIAAALAADVARLRTLRGSLRETMQRSPLMDAARFAHCIEHAYRDAWRALPRRAALSLSAAEMSTRS